VRLFDDRTRNFNFEFEKPDRFLSFFPLDGWDYRLRIAMGAARWHCDRHSHPPNPGQSLSPADPPIALQSFTRDAPFPRREWRDALFEGPFNSPSKLACFVFPQRVDSALPAICEGCSTLTLRSPLGDGETQCSKVHSGEAQDGPSLRSQAVRAHCVLALA